jgi:hypothetical protein
MRCQPAALPGALSLRGAAARSGLRQGTHLRLGPTLHMGLLGAVLPASESEKDAHYIVMQQVQGRASGRAPLPWLLAYACGMRACVLS